MNKDLNNKLQFMFVSMVVCGPTLTFELSMDSVGVGCISMIGARV